ncbi:putative calcium-binding protein CML46 [Camellia lanceoleosa]|uniref:Calcium-binding protein CML46 n=1 Tax=Camellia lanceoleosa TaxID=1840588 RepID=A0ACC0J5T5_9ERIC|nr:putative calcium-binding protein CML46 [Camellia lanceoleosa]
MSLILSYPNQFPIENVSIKSLIPLVCVVFCMFQFFLLKVLLSQLRRFYKILSTSGSFIKSKFADLKPHQAVKNKIQDFELSNSNHLAFSDTEKIEDEHLCREDVEMVMARLGILCNPEDEKLVEKLDSNDLSNLFEEKEPSLEELKGAFDVFDENGDGFIDSKELQRVVCLLGFKEGSEIGNCRRMISAFDDNGDDRIDFGEFVKFMENTFS